MSEPSQHPPSLSGPDYMGRGIFLSEMWKLRLKMVVAFWRGQLFGGRIRVEFGLACLQQRGLLSVLTNDPFTRDASHLVLLASCYCLSGCKTWVQDLSMSNPGTILPVYLGHGSQFSSCYPLATVAASVMGIYGDCGVPGSGCLF